MFDFFSNHSERSTWTGTVLLAGALLALNITGVLMDPFSVIGILNMLFTAFWIGILIFQLTHRPPKTKEWRKIDLHNSDI